MLNVTIEAENSKLKVCYSSEIGKKTAVCHAEIRVIQELAGYLLKIVTKFIYAVV